jgi:GTP cyclohydrolase II
MKDKPIVAVDLLFERQVDTRFGTWTERLFRFANSDIIVLGRGDWRSTEAPLARVHSTCFSAHYLESTECECREQLTIAFQRIAAEGTGLIILLDQDGRGNGHAAAMRAAVYAERALCTQSEAYRAVGYPAEARSFAGAAAVLLHLGLRSIRLMTNNPDKVAALTDAGISAVAAPLVVPSASNPRLESFYRNKVREGHILSDAPANT